MSLPTKAAPLVVGLGSLAAIQEKLSNTVNEALAELAGTIVAGSPVERRPAE